MKDFFKKKNKKNKLTTGFTLVETLVALFIFSLSVVVVMAVFSKGISGTNYAKNKIIATYLAQEGIEYFRNLRDTEMLYAENKLEGWAFFVEKMKIGGCDGSESNLGCIVENSSVPVNLIWCKVYGECPNLKFDGINYNYNYGPNSVFIRKMFFKMIDMENVEIFSEVSWTSGNGGGQILFSEKLSAWIE